MVGRAATIRLKKISPKAHNASECTHTAGLVILPSCMGTLKSTRIRTRLPLRSTSVMASLLERDMADKRMGRLSRSYLSFCHWRAPEFRVLGVSLCSFPLYCRRNRTGPLVPDLARPTQAMATPDPPPNSLGLDIVQTEPALDAQPTIASPPSPPSEPTTQPSTNATDSVANDTAVTPTTPATATDKVDDATKSNVLKKTPYVNLERVKTGGLPRVNLVSL